MTNKKGNIVQLYTDRERTTKAYPKTLAESVYVDENTTIKEKIDALNSTTLTFNTINDLKQYKGFKIGDIVTTLGYIHPLDNGGAKYKIVDLETYKSLHSPDIRALITGADEYGSFTVNDHLIAYNSSIEHTPEQWGAVGDGVTNNVVPFIHLLAKIKNGIIRFKPSAKYLMYETTFINPYKSNMIGKPLGGYETNYPLLANIDGLIIEGNNATIEVAKGKFTMNDKYSINFSAFMLGGSINDLTIRNIRFNGNGFSQDMTGKPKVFTNHNLAYLPSTLPSQASTFTNVTIENCEFYEGGVVNRPSGNDFGGDGILIISPSKCKNIKINNNKFVNVGRWAIAFDLNFDNNVIASNVEIDNNTFIMHKEDAVREPKTRKERNLGFIDFEIYHSWKNLRISNNKIYATGCGIAIGGGQEAYSEYVYIENNTIVSEDNPTNSYYYILSIYNQKLKNVYYRNNDITLGKPRATIPISFGDRNKKLTNLYFTGNTLKYIEQNNAYGVYFNDKLELDGDIFFVGNYFETPIGIVLENPLVSTKNNVRLHLMDNNFTNCKLSGYHIVLNGKSEINKYDHYNLNLIGNYVNDCKIDAIDSPNTVFKDVLMTVGYGMWGNGKMSTGTVTPPIHLFGVNVKDIRLSSNQEAGTNIIGGRYNLGQIVTFPTVNSNHESSAYYTICKKAGCGAYSYNTSTYTQHPWQSNEVGPSYRSHNGKMYLWLGGKVSCGTIAPTHSTGIVSNWRYIDEVAEFTKMNIKFK